MSPFEKPLRPPLVLVANDQEWSARSLESILGPNGYAVLRAYTGRQALDLARSAQPDVVIVDVRMPDIDGLDVCEVLRDDPRFTPGTPIIVTASGPSGRTQRLAAFRAGAWEFCTQPLDGEVLLMKLQTFLGAKREVDRVRDESLLDQATGLYNLRGLARRAREIGAEASRRHEALACVAFAPEADVAPTSERGVEEMASRVVGHVGEVFRRSGRISDAIGRLGQAEFALVAPATPSHGVIRLVERLRTEVESAPLAVDGAARTLRIRAGYCVVPDFAESSVDAVEILLRATTALRHARAAGNGTSIRAFDDVPLTAAT